MDRYSCELLCENTEKQDGCSANEENLNEQNLNLTVENSSVETAHEPNSGQNSVIITS